MTFYQQYVAELRKRIYPKEYLCNQVMQAKLFIDSNYAGHINLDKVAAEALLSKFHFIRVFKSLYGRTAHQYLTEVRIAKAKILLQEGMAVSDVCFSVGFDSVTSFTGLFKKITGTSPSLYQNKIMLKKAILKRHN